jgi:hypothetical protein
MKLTSPPKLWGWIGEGAGAVLQARPINAKTRGDGRSRPRRAGRQLTLRIQCLSYSSRPRRIAPLMADLKAS